MSVEIMLVIITVIIAAPSVVGAALMIAHQAQQQSGSA